MRKSQQNKLFYIIMIIIIILALLMLLLVHIFNTSDESYKVYNNSVCPMEEKNNVFGS